MKPVEDEKEKYMFLFQTQIQDWDYVWQKKKPESDQTNSGYPDSMDKQWKNEEQNYKEAVRANNPEALVAIIKMIYQRKQKRLAQGKKCTATDARYFQIAENLLYMELGVALEKPKQEICKTTIDYIDQNKIDWYAL